MHMQVQFSEINDLYNNLKQNTVTDYSNRVYSNVITVTLC